MHGHPRFAFASERALPGLCRDIGLTLSGHAQLELAALEGDSSLLPLERRLVQASLLGLTSYDLNAREKTNAVLGLLRRAFPGVVFRVKLERVRSWSAMDEKAVLWTDGPRETAVAAVLGDMVERDFQHRGVQVNSISLFQLGRSISWEHRAAILAELARWLPRYEASFASGDLRLAGEGLVAWVSVDARRPHVDLRDSPRTPSDEEAEALCTEITALVAAIDLELARRNSPAPSNVSPDGAQRSQLA